MRTGFIRTSLAGFLLGALVASCSKESAPGASDGSGNGQATTREPFGQVEGRDVGLFTLRNANGMEVKISDYGGTVTSITIPDAHGGKADVVCGFDTLEGYFSEEYKENAPYFGGIVGRYAAFMKDSRFELDGETHELSANVDPHHLHGGAKGFDKCVWDAEIADDGDRVLRLSLVSPDGDQGYPGELKVSVEYRLNDDNELRIRYRATTDKATAVSMTNHTYFNLNGFKDKVLDHVLQLKSDRHLVPGESGVPEGDEAKVAGKATDFNEAKRIGDAFEELTHGFEHFYLFDNPEGELESVVKVSEPTSGRTLEVLTTEPGTLLYTGRYTSDDLAREDGTKFGQFRGFCIETSKYPNGPNIEGAPRCILKPGEEYDETTVFRLGWGG